MVVDGFVVIFFWCVEVLFIKVVVYFKNESYLNLIDFKFFIVI